MTNAFMRSFSGCAGVLLLSSGCGGDDTTRMLGLELSETSSPTYGEHVSPIFNEKCVRCHQVGGVGPFRLDDYQTARAWSNRIGAATEARVMPPYLMDTGGECGSFDETRALGDDEIATIAEWVRNGAPEGIQTQLTLPALPTLGDARAWRTPVFAPQIWLAAQIRLRPAARLDRQLPAATHL